MGKDYSDYDPSLYDRKKTTERLEEIERMVETVREVLNKDK